MQLHTIVLPDGTQLRSGAEELCSIKKVRLTESVNAGKELTLGSACAAMLEVTLLGQCPALTAGMEVTLYRGQTQLGIFRLEAPEIGRPGMTKLVGYDRMVLLDKDLTTWLEARQWPCSLLELARAVCSQCGLELENTALPNGDMQVSAFRKRGVTGRQLMQYIGQAAGQFCRATAEGRLLFAGYENSELVIKPTGESFYFAGGFSRQGYTVEPVEGVQVQLSQSSQGYLWPTMAEEKNRYILSGNPVLCRFPQATQTVLDTICAQIPHGYMPCTLSVPASCPARPGQIVQVEDSQGEKYRVAVMTRITAGQRAILECTGSARRDSTAATNQKTPTQQAAQLVQGQSQGEIFDILTDGGRLQGLYIQDGRLYINAELVKILNLFAERIRSYGSDGCVEIDDGCISLYGEDGQNVVSIVSRQDSEEEGTYYPMVMLTYWENGERKYYCIQNGNGLWLRSADNLNEASIAFEENGLNRLKIDSITPSGKGNCKWQYDERLGKTVLVQK